MSHVGRQAGSSIHDAAGNQEQRSGAPGQQRQHSEPGEFLDQQERQRQNTNRCCDNMSKCSATNKCCGNCRCGSSSSSSSLAGSRTSGADNINKDLPSASSSAQGSTVGQFHQQSQTQQAGSDRNR